MQIDAQRGNSMMRLHGERLCAEKWNEAVWTDCMCWASRFAQPHTRAARSPTAPGYMASGMPLSMRGLRVTSSSVANLPPRAVQASGPAHPARGM